MKKWFGMMAAAGALMLASTGSFASESGTFFINGNVGQSHYQGGSFNDRRDAAEAVRAGYLWQNDAFDFGVETGYVNLGQASGNVVPGESGTRFSVKAKGALLGANFKYKFDNKMFLAARAGWFHSSLDFHTNFAANLQSSHRNGNYAGMTYGYDFNPHFSFGVSFDHYEPHAQFEGRNVHEDARVYSGFAEYRY